MTSKLKSLVRDLTENTHLNPFGLYRPANVSKNNRLTHSYIYGFNTIISPSNRLIDSEIEVAENKDNENQVLKVDKVRST